MKLIYDRPYPSESEWSSWLGGGSGDKLSLTLEADEAALELGLESDLNIDWPCFLAEVGSQRPPCALCSPAEAGVTNIEGTRWYNLCWWMFGAEGHLGIPPVGSNCSKSSSIDCCFLKKKIDTFKVKNKIRKCVLESLQERTGKLKGGKSNMKKVGKLFKLFYSNKKMNKQEVLFVPVPKGKLKAGRRKKKEIVDLK